MTRAAAAFVAALCFGPPAAALEPRAEIQINLCSAPSEVKDALKLGEKGRPTIVWLFDTPSLALQSQGLRLRLRESGKNSDLTLKAAGQDCRALDPPLRPPDGKCEADLHGDSFDDVVSLTRRIDASERRALSAAPASGAALAATIGSLLTREQRALLETRRADSGSSLLPADIVRLGPSSVVSLASK
ncbi:MAG TPA: hypothetical protein VMK32_13875, partial [Burkholderiaceae bacterium]|nr:hypothetical protein [Burkholderiaceae bacterium]